MSNKRDVENWSLWITSIIERKSWRSYLVTFQFNPMIGSEMSILNRMNKEIGTFYTRLLTAAVRDPRAKSQYWKRPIMIGAFDQPVPKNKKTTIEAWLTNDGVHGHAIASLPETGRFEGRLEDHLECRATRYLSYTPYLNSVHAKAILETPERLGPYLLKSIDRSRFSSDTIFVYPESLSEATKGQYLG